METIDYYIQLTVSLYHEAVELNSSAISLEDLFKQEAERLHRLDQASLLRTIKFQIAGDTERIQASEESAEGHSSKVGLVSGIGRFGLGLFVANMSNEPIVRWMGKQMLSSDLGKPKPFGTVVVAIGREGLPEGVEVISLSRLARRDGVSESKVEEVLREEDLILITPKAFYKLLESLEKKVIESTISLPVSLEQIRSELANYD